MLRTLILFLTFFSFSSHVFASDALYRAIENKQWGTAMSEAGSDALMLRFVEWNALRDQNNDVNISQLAHFIKNYSHWPSMETIKTRAEKLLFRQGKTSLPWKATSAYGELINVRGGNKSLLKHAWINGNFAREDELSIIKEFAGRLSPADHRARIERLLADDRASIAERFLLYADKTRLPLYKARIALIRRDRNVDAKIDAIPSALKNDPWLLCDRIIWRKKKKLYSGAAEGLRQMRRDSPCAYKVWKIRAEIARDEIEAKRYKNALALLKNFGPLEGAARAESLWLRGWLNYTFLKDYRSAYDDFSTLYKNVSYPISKARGSYWSARAAEKLNDSKRAQANYQIASRYPTTFYGQLAFAKLYPGKPLGFPKPPSSGNVDTLLKSDLMQISKRLVDDDKIELANPLISHLGKQADTPQKIATLAAASKKLGARFLGVRAAKFAAKQNLVLLREGWPTTNIPKSALEPALPHAIARQESEFNKRAVSHANARGLMQLLPGTARLAARELGIDYSLSKLFEPSYNAQLGSAYLASLIDKFNGSYILAIAGYNAGPNRSNQWIDRFGYPGRDLDKTLTWIESIPFSETRNYVQRVLENAQTYRAVMNPRTPLGIENDLLR